MGWNPFRKTLSVPSAESERYTVPAGNAWMRFDLDILGHRRSKYVRKCPKSVGESACGGQAKAEQRLIPRGLPRGRTSEVSSDNSSGLCPEVSLFDCATLTFRKLLGKMSSIHCHDGNGKRKRRHHRRDCD